VSIGLPVYNGEAFLEQAISSILAQTFADYELIISDNASTDSTPEICERFASADARIKYSRNSKNIGGARNENRTVELAQGVYFRFAAHDDFLEPSLLERCVEILDSHPDVVSCHTKVREVDENVGETRVISRTGATRGPAYRRFANIVLGKTFLEENYGLIRLDILRAIPLQRNYVGSDRPFMAELALMGRFAEVPEVLFNKRLHPANQYVDWRNRTSWFTPDAAGSVSLPWWSQLADLISRCRHADVSARTRLECAGVITVWFILKSPKLAKDLVLAAYSLIKGRDWRLARARSTSNWESATPPDRTGDRIA
jgi:glycosyltransferase involved in cell wall biosynthesis